MKCRFYGIWRHLVAVRNSVCPKFGLESLEKDYYNRFVFEFVKIYVTIWIKKCLIFKMILCFINRITKNHLIPEIKQSFFDIIFFVVSA